MQVKHAVETASHAPFDKCSSCYRQISLVWEHQDDQSVFFWEFLSACFDQIEPDSTPAHSAQRVTNCTTNKLYADDLVTSVVDHVLFHGHRFREENDKMAVGSVVVCYRRSLSSVCSQPHGTHSAVRPG